MFSMKELLFLQHELTENKYAKDSYQETRKATLEKITNIIKERINK